MIFSRMSGAGNSFYLCDEWSDSAGIESALRPVFAKKLCGLFSEAPTDGFIVLKRHPLYDFEWDFYNADGTAAEMCGNAARCVGLYFYERIRSQKKIHFLSGAGPIEAELLEDHRVRVVMPKATRSVETVETHFFINTGVPHIVVEGSPDLDLAKKLRPLPRPSGANVTFVSHIHTEAQSAKCKAVTFERGVEGWTAACGTGAVAAAAYLSKTRACTSSEIEMPGGVLQVKYNGLGRSSELIGSVQFDYEFEIEGSPSQILGLENK